MFDRPKVLKVADETSEEFYVVYEEHVSLDNTNFGC